MKKDKKLNIWNISVNNLKARKYRTAFMGFFVVLMSATFCISTLLMNNLEMGIKNTTDKIGADMIVAPRDAAFDIRDSLYAGEPCSEFYDKDYESEISDIEGIDRWTSQLLVGTLAASCCTAQVQLIAIDPDTDFTVSSWLNGGEKINLKKGEVVVGAGLFASEGDTVTFYKTDFKVASKLSKSGMGYDNSVFMTRESIDMLKSSDVAQEHLPMDKIDNLSSIILVDLKDGLTDDQVRDVKAKLRYLGGDYNMNTFEPTELMGELSAQVKKLAGYGNFMTALLVIATALALISIFSITINERKYEFGILATLGARKKTIMGIILAEALTISVVGGLVGSLFGTYGVILFKELIGAKMGIPFFDTGIGVAGPIIATCLAIAIVTGIIAAVYSSYRIGKGEAYRLIRDNE